MSVYRNLSLPLYCASCPARVCSICGQPAGRMRQSEAVDYETSAQLVQPVAKIDLKPVTRCRAAGPASRW